MSTSPTMKETVLPPHGPPSPLSSHAHLSPRLLTPDSDGHNRTPAFDTLVFTKQPIPRKSQPRDTPNIQPYSPFTESEASDGHMSEAYQPGSRPHSPVKPHHLSLLTAVLSSPDHTAPKPNAPREPGRISITNGMISGSSNPSTTMSSPAAREPHGILQRQPSVAKVADPAPSSILRRESQGTGDEQAAGPGVGLGLTMNDGSKSGAEKGQNGLDGLAKRLEKVEERRERIGWADTVDKVTPTFPNLARVPSTGSSIGPRPRLQFAVAHPPSLGSTSASEAGDAPGRPAPSSTNSSRRPSSPFAKERKVQESLDEQGSDDEEEVEDEDEEDADETPLEEPPRNPGYNSRSTSSSGRRSSEIHSPIDEEDDEDDLGYQEDEEDGMFSDEEETTAFDLSGDLVKRKFAFARPTNYSRGRRSSRDDISPATTPPPPAPTFFPPPNRRGRGHVRVADPTLTVAKTEKKGCSRHCSPPPSSRSRSGSKVEHAPPAIASPSARFMKRPEALAPGPGPSKQRIVGSPMPPRVFAAESDEDEDEEDEEDEVEEDEGEEEEDEKTPQVPRGGWRSDDSVFYGPGARVPSRAIKPFTPQTHNRNLSAPLDRAVFDESADEDQSVSVSMAREASMEGPVGGVRHWIRRASELSGFSRPSVDIRRSSGDGASSAGASGRSREGSRDVSCAVGMPTQATAPPATDYTPIVACSFSKHTEGGLASRLEQTLTAAGSTPSSTISPAPPMSRDATASSTASAMPTPPGRPDAGAADPLNRAVSMSNRVTFRPTEKPVRAAPPQRAVSTAGHYLATQKTRGVCLGLGAGSIGSGPGVAPIRCPKRVQGEDLGWSDEALMSIRRKAGKGE